MVRKKPISKKSSAVDPSHDHYGYLHGYNRAEQERLVQQARFYEPVVYRNVRWPEGCREVLEPGCGVGAQTEVLLRRFPQLHVTGVDRSPSQIARAKKNLAAHIRGKRATFVQGSGEKLPFEDSRFHGAWLCWLLEHVPEPVALLREVHRCLQPGALIYATEVLNSSFFLHPYAPATLQYWFIFNDHQWNMKGDPFCGAKLGNHLLDAGFQDIETNVCNYLLDKRTPKLRDEHLKSWHRLLLSAAPSLMEAGRVDDALLKELDREWKAALKDPEAVLFYSFVQAKAVAL